MTYYEIKKIFSKLSSKIVVLLLLVVVVFAGFSAINEVRWTDSNGETHTGILAAKKLKEEKEKWAGPLTEERLREIIKEVRKANIVETEGADNVREANIAYSKVQGMEDIRLLASGAYGGAQEFNYFAIDSLSPDDAKDFYPNRVKVMKEWFNKESERFSEDEKEFLLEQYKEPEGPWDYQYADGWHQLFDHSPIPMIVIVLVLGFLVSGVFPGESRLKADSIYFSSYHGRGKATFAKIKAGFLVVTICYWAAMLLYSGIVLGALGTGGADCVIQTGIDGWKSFYHMTYGQEFLMILFGGYLGSLFISFFTMLISAKADSAVIAVTIPFILVFIPTFLKNTNLVFVEKILGITPDQLVQLNLALDDFNLYHIGGTIAGAIPVVFVLYLILLLIIFPLLYFIYRKKSVV